MTTRNHVVQSLIRRTFVAGLVLSALAGGGLTKVFAEDTVAVPTTEGAQPEARQALIVVMGAAGSEEFVKPFQQAVDRWKQLAGMTHTPIVVIGEEASSEATDRQRFEEALRKSVTEEEKPLWLVLIGHGTFNGAVARFNLQGPDVSSKELAEWVKEIKRPLVIINGASSSGPFINDLSGKNRVIVTATRSGHEYNYARFGEFIAAAIPDPAADLDKDGQTSLLEAWLLASSRVLEFYADEGRLATEHALLDDNGDRLGTPPDWFRGVRAIKSAKAGAVPDGDLARRLVFHPVGREQQLDSDQRQRRDELEAQLASIRSRKAMMSEEEYLAALEKVLLELGDLLLGPVQ